MSVTHPATVRSAIADFVVDRIDAGDSNGVLQMQTSSNTEVATVKFSDPAFGSATVGVATANALTADADAVGGVIAKARAYDSDDGTTPGNEVFACSVTAQGGGGDIELNNINVTAGQQVGITSLTYTACA